MNYLSQFKKDFWDNKIDIRQFYWCDNSNPSDSKSENHRDLPNVVSDLYNHHRPISAACLPIAKQIVGSDQQITIKLPRISDLLIGIQHQPTISMVTFTVNNYSESITVEGQLRQVGAHNIWIFTELPIPLISLAYDDNIFLEVSIKLNNQYSLQAFNQDVFKAYCGYFNRSIQFQTINQAVYDIPLCDQKSSLSIVCGLWTIKSENRHDFDQIGKSD
jgi:hypothetical protein